MQKKLIIFLSFLLLTVIGISQVKNKSLDTELIDYRQIKLGIVKLEFSKVKFKYFTKNFTGSLPYNQFNEWKKNNQNTLLYTSCSYVDNCDVEIGRSVGLTIINGEIINRTIEEKLPGICLIDNNGFLAIKNIEIDGFINKIKLTNKYYQGKIIKRLINNYGSCFQTHLLWYIIKRVVITNSKPRKRG